MRTKNNSATTIVIVSFLILTTIASVGFYFSKPQAFALANSEPTQQPEKTVEAVTSQATSQEILSVTQNDLTVEITSAQAISTGLEIGICYTTPDGGEWRPMPGRLFYDKYEVYPDEIEFTSNEKLADGKNTGTRCAFIRYLIDDLNTLATPIEFSILRFYAPGREMYSACEELQQRLDTNSKAQTYDLKVRCEERADGSADITLLDNNKSITTEEAQNILDIIASAEIAGNWKFTITDMKK